MAREWRRRGHAEEARQLFEAAELVATTAGDGVNAARAAVGIAHTDYARTDLIAAEASFERAANTLLRVGETQQGLRAKISSAFIPLDAGNLDRASERLIALEVQTRRERLVAEHASVLGYQGNVARALGRWDEAHRFYEHAVLGLEAQGDFLYAATFSMDAAVTHLLAGRLAEAFDRLRHARRLAAATESDAYLEALLAHYQALATLLAYGSKEALRVETHAAGPDTAAVRFLGRVRELVGVLRGATGATRRRAIRSLDELEAERFPYEHGRISVLLARTLFGDGAPSVERLVVTRGRKTVSLDGAGEVDLADRPVLWRLVRTLVEQHRTHPGKALDPSILIAAGWDGESMLARAARNRLHVALATLRQLGLRTVIVRHPGGYLLRPGLEVLCVD